MKMRKRRIFIMINSLGIGGAEKSLLSVLSLLDPKRYEIDLQLMIYGETFEQMLPKSINLLPPLDYTIFCKKSLKKQVESFRFKLLFTRVRTSIHLKLNKYKRNPLHDSQVYWKICKNMYMNNTQRYDVAIAWGQGTPTHYVAEKILADRKYAWINADYMKVGHNKEFDRAFYSQYNKIICVSNELSLIIKEVFPEYQSKVDVIYDIINSEIISRMSYEQIKLPFYSNIVIVTVGRYAPSKNYLLALETAKELRNKGIDFVWYAIGEGSERSKLEKYISTNNLEDCFILLGSKNNPYPYMNACDIYVQTSRDEGYCITLAEARILGCLCVTTNFDAVYEQIIDHENGIIKEMKAEAIADGIMELLNNKALCKHIAHNLKKEKIGNTSEIEKIERLLL